MNVLEVLQPQHYQKLNLLLSHFNLLYFCIPYLSKWHDHSPSPPWHSPNLFFQPFSSAMTSSENCVFYLNQMTIPQTFKLFKASYCSTCLECLLHHHNNLLQSFSIKMSIKCLYHARHCLVLGIQMVNKKTSFLMLSS